MKIVRKEYVFLERKNLNELENRISDAISHFQEKFVRSDYTTDKAFLDGSLLILQWMQEELKRLKRTKESGNMRE